MKKNEELNELEYIKDSKKYGWSTNTAIEHCFFIIKYLHVYKLVKGKELADKLNVSTKQITRYIHSLRKVGININSRSGRNGGYYLKDDKCPLCNQEW